jgi:hypothetical protein
MAGATRVLRGRVVGVLWALCVAHGNNWFRVAALSVAAYNVWWGGKMAMRIDARLEGAMRDVMRFNEEDK